MNLIRSEWTKMVSLRSTWLTALTTVVLGIGIGALIASGQARSYGSQTPAEQALWDPASTSLNSLIISQLAIGVLGTLVITSEYATGMIAPSLVAAPRRGRLLAAKAGVLAAAAVLIGQLIGFASFFLGQALIGAADVPNTSLGAPGVLRAVVGSGLYLAALGLLGLAFGVILRSTAGAITTLVSITLLVRLLSTTLPRSWAKWMDDYWPTTAGLRIITVVDTGRMPPWPSFGILCGFVAATMAAGLVLLRTRDA